MFIDEDWYNEKKDEKFSYHTHFAPSQTKRKMPIYRGDNSIRMTWLQFTTTHDLHLLQYYHIQPEESTVSHMTENR